MGTNSSKWDRDAHYARMTTRQLEDLRDWWDRRLEERSNTVGRVEVAHIRMLIAQRIGKKGTT